MTDRLTKRPGLMPRKADTRRRRRIILIICEGAKTELTYFNDLRLLAGRDNQISIRAITKTGVAPLKLVEYARKRMLEDGLDHSVGDQAWCVFDVDDRSDDDIMGAVKAAGRYINLAISNPCFELWYLLHFDYTTVYMDPVGSIRRLRRHVCNYEKNKSITYMLLAETENAIDRATKLVLYHKGNLANIPCRAANPLTLVHELVRVLGIPQQL